MLALQRDSLVRSAWHRCFKMYCARRESTVIGAALVNRVPTRSEFVADASSTGLRLDRFVAARCPTLSRARIQELIEEGLVRLNGASAKAAQKLRAGDRICVEAQERPPLTAEPEAIPLEILYEDDDVLMVNKPAGMSVHAGAGNSRGTLVNALLGR